MAWALAQEFQQHFGLNVNKDEIIAGGLLHDVGKPFEFDPERRKQWQAHPRVTGFPSMRHSVYGAYVAFAVGLLRMERKKSSPTSKIRFRYENLFADETAWIPAQGQRRLQRLVHNLIENAGDAVDLAVSRTEDLDPGRLEISVQLTAIPTGGARITIADRGSALVELDVSENYTGMLEVGDRVDLTVGSTRLQGTIQSIGRLEEASSDGLGATITVRVIPDPTDSLLLPGSSVVGELRIGVQEDVLYLARGPYLTTGSQKYLYRVEENDATARRIDVSFGSIQGNNVIILDGIKEGDPVIISGYQNFIEYEIVKLEEAQKR